jgi:serine protease Do
MVNRRLLGLLLRVLVVVIGCGAAGTARAQAKTPQRALGFSNLVFRPAGGDQVGLAGEDFRVHILEDLRGRGVNAVGAENLVFGSDHGGQAEMMLGGTVTELECQPGSVSGNISCRMGIEWQVLDVASDTVVYKVLSRARVLDAPKEPVVTLGKRMVVANLESLSKHAAFQRLLQPQPTSKPTQGYARATLRICKAAPRPMPASSEQVLDATVLVQTSGGFGSGFLLGADGFVATAAHVVPGTSATVKLRDGRQFPAAVIRSDRRLDIALLRLALPEGATLPCLPSKLGPVSVGSDVYAIGSPASRDLSFSLARGIVSGVRLLDGVQYLQTDAAVNRGNSGGPLVTASGEAAAIVSYKLVGTSVEGIAFGVPLGPGLNALGVNLGNAFTSPELVSAGAVAAGPAPKLFVDASDAQPDLGAPTGQRDTRVQGVGGRNTNPEVKRALYMWGGTAVLTGLSLVLTAVLLESSTNRDGYNSANDSLKTYRNIGWGTTIVGGALVGVGFALP